MNHRRITSVAGLFVLLACAGTAHAAGTIVPYTKHNTTVGIAYVWRIPVVVIRWDWEMSFKKLNYPGGPPSNVMSGLSGVDQLGDTTRLHYMSNMVNMNQLVLEDGLGGSQTYTITSGFVDYTTGPNIGGLSPMSISDLSITGTLDSPDIFGLGPTFDISFLGAAGVGSIFLGDPNGPEVFSTNATGLLASTHLAFPGAVLPEDQSGYNGIGDWSGPFEVPTPMSSLILACFAVLRVRRRR